MEFDYVNIHFSNAFKLVFLYIFGPETNIQVPKEMPKAYIVMPSNKYFQVESFLLLCYTIVGVRK